MIANLAKELRLSLRGLLRRPTLTATVLLTLAIGTAAATIVAALIEAVLLRPFPFPRADEMVEIRTVSTLAEGNEYGCSFPDATDLAAGASSLVDVGSFREARINVVPDDRAVPARVVHVTPGFFDVLRTQPLLGRVFELEDDLPGGDSRKAVLSYSAWQSMFGGRQNILGHSLRTAMGPFEVIGVMPAGASYPAQTDLWVPLQSQFDIRGFDRSDPRQRSARLDYRAIARLGPGADLERSRVEIATVSQRLSEQYAETNGDFAHQLITFRESEAGAVRPYLMLLLVAVALVVAVCCSNTAGLLVSRTAARLPEFALRSTLGAGRGGLARLLLTESALVGVIGGSLGLLIALLAVRWSAGAVGSWNVLPAWAELRLAPPVLLAGGLVALTSGLIAGLGPLAFFRRAEGVGAMTSTRTTGPRLPIQSFLVVAQVALSMILLVSTGLLLSSIGRLQRVDTGLHTERVLTVSLSAYRGGNNEERIRAVTSFYRQVIDRFEQIPGVLSVGGSDNFPFGSRYSVERHEQRVEARGDSEETIGHRAGALLIDVTPDYFQAVGVPLLSGRPFTEDDTLEAPWVIALSETAARTLFPDREAVGQEVRITYEGGGADPWARVVAVVGDVKYGRREGGSGFELYYPYTQWGLASTTLALRMRGPLEGFDQQIRNAVHAVDPETAVERIAPMDELLGDTLWRERLLGRLLVLCTGVAVLLAAIGLYGVLSFSVSHRRREIGVRLAVGSTPRQILLEVTRGGMGLIAVGLGIGALGALLAVPLLRSYLFASEGLDLAAWAVPVSILTVVGLFACLRPSIVAARVDPVRSLRQE